MNLMHLQREKVVLVLYMMGYDKCHNWEDVIESRGYNKDADIEYTSTSIFCSKGQGYLVKWDKVKEEVHCDLEGLI